MTRRKLVDDLFQWVVPAFLIGMLLVQRRDALGSTSGTAMFMAVQILLLLFAAPRAPYPALVASIVLQLVACASGHAPNYGVGAIPVIAGSLRARAEFEILKPVLVALAVAGIVAFVPVMLDLQSSAVFVRTTDADQAVGTLAYLVIASLMYGDQRWLYRLLEGARVRAEAAEAANADAVAAERARIGRELHDVVAHQMSVVVTQAQGAEALLDRDPARVREALGTISSTTRDALVEMRRLVDVDRGDGRPPTDVQQPQPGLAYEDYARLAERAEAAGLQDVRFTLNKSGEREPPPGVALSVHRLIQEAITNASKHSPGATLAVDVGDDGASIAVEVRNGPAARPSADIPGAGVGLIGMRERVEFFGGTLETGPTPDGGWSVRATFPTLEAPSTSE